MGEVIELGLFHLVLSNNSRHTGEYNLCSQKAVDIIILFTFSTIDDLYTNNLTVKRRRKRQTKQR